MTRIMALSILVSEYTYNNERESDVDTTWRGSVQTIKLHVTLSAAQYALRKGEVAGNRCFISCIFTFTRKRKNDY